LALFGYLCSVVGFGTSSQATAAISACLPRPRSSAPHTPYYMIPFQKYIYLKVVAEEKCPENVKIVSGIFWRKAPRDRFGSVSE